VEIAQADVARLTTHRDFVEEELRVGDVTKTALFRAKAELAKSLTTKLVARNDVSRNKADMIRLTGAERGFSVTDKGLSDLEKFSATFETILDRAMENRYEVKQLQINLKMAAQKIEYEKGAYWPALILEGGYRETDFSYDLYGQKDGYDTEDAYIQANLVFTLFDGADRGARMKKAVLEVKKIRQDLSAQKKQIVYEAETAFLDLKTARETLHNLEEELISARENYSAVQMQFKYGMTDSIEIMDANTLMVQAQTRMADARYTLYLAALKIIYTQGNLIHYLLSFG
jgi:outer membrane protein